MTLPKFVATTALAVVMSTAVASAKNLVEMAVEAGNFSTLVAAAQAAGLDGALAGNGPLTVFAPTDEAFAKLPAGTVADLLKPENKDKLIGILTYHVVNGAVMSGDIADGMSSVGTLNESASLKISKSADGVMVGDAKVTSADIKADNGVIHVIDSVLIPAQ